MSCLCLKYCIWNMLIMFYECKNNRESMDMLYVSVGYTICNYYKYEFIAFVFVMLCIALYCNN